MNIEPKEKLLKIINHYGVIPQLKYFQSEYIPLGEDERKSYYLNKRETYNTFSLPDTEIAALSFS